MARLLALDYGKKRTGIAVSDSLQIIAGGLRTVETHDLMAFLDLYFKKEKVERVIVGLPTQMDGSPSENETRILGFIENFKHVFPKMPIERYDERFTSVLAQRTMLESGIGKHARRNKALVDEISATIILQSYMEYKLYKH